MSEFEAASEDVDETGVEILRLLAQRSGKADAAELRQAMDGVSPDSFNYRRREHLVAHGLVETHQPEPSPEGRVPPKVLTLTERGEDFLDSVVDAGPVTLEERLDQLEEQVEVVRRENRELREENRELREAIERRDGGDVETELQSIRADMDTLQSRLRMVEDHPVITSDISPAAINGGVVLGNTCKRLFESELGEQHVEQVRTEVKSELRENGSLVESD
jgi:DNA-binding transcriptional ArsR family regulator